MADRFTAFRHRDFRLLWSANVVSRVGTQMREVALSWQVYVLTKSALALGMIGACRVIPIVVFAMAGGVAADAFDRRRILLTTQTILTVTSAAMAFFTWRGMMSVPLLYGLIAVSAATQAFDGPARQTLVTNLLPDEDLPNGLTLQVSAIQLAMAVGPAVGGIVLAATSIQAVYVIDAISFLAVIGALFVIEPKYAKAPKGAKPDVSLAAIKSALSFLKTNSVLVWLMVADFLATFFAGSLQLLPIYASDIFHVGARGLGWLVSAPAVGSVIASASMSARRPVQRTGMTVIISIAIYGACVAAFGVCPSFPIALLLLAGSGAADSVSTVVRQVVRQTLTPDEMRGRMTGVNMMFFIGGPQLGEVEAGVVAQLTSPVVSVTSGGVACILVALGIGAGSTALRSLRARPPASEGAGRS